uniref:MRPL25 domain-containing protein n=1 Tax=Phaeomonas parva TaxID=124430 RepID=A0A7S1XMQ3_9STRA|mmetsp:Transcript_1716/g.4849  ORF Transcript_1716/g.4849 Transcript_1716/m.4849 type:complete len:143 (+) Transcript_1716:80-508(+)
MPPQPGTRALMKLAKLGGEALKPQKVDGRWRKAAISAKNQARLRKTALMEGTFGKFDPATGKGWDPAWDPVSKVVPFRPRRLRRRERTREERFQRIQTKLKDVDRLAEENRLERKARKPVIGIAETYKKLLGFKVKPTFTRN